MKNITIFLLGINFIWTNINAQSISNISPNKYILFDTIEDSISYKFVNIKKDLALISYKRPNEFFTPTDTIRRDYILLEGKVINLDSLFGKSDSKYTINYSLLESYFIEKNDVEYLILFGGDTFFSMSMDNPSYLIFIKQNKVWNFYNVYHLNTKKSSSKIKCKFNKDKLILKGKKVVSSE